MAARRGHGRLTATIKEGAMAAQILPAEPGDRVLVESHRVGEAARKGEILEVLGIREFPHYRVRWEDGRETLFYPSNDARIIRAHLTKPKRRGGGRR
jgi:hypothetical protein